MSFKAFALQEGHEKKRGNNVLPSVRTDVKRLVGHQTPDLWIQNKIGFRCFKMQNVSIAECHEMDQWMCLIQSNLLRTSRERNFDCNLFDGEHVLTRVLQQ